MVIIIMGVCGAGKTTIGSLLAQSLGAKFVEGDDFHPPANISKMQNGLPLTDEDRWPWLNALAAAIGQWQRDGLDVVLSCSALKQSYRQILMAGGQEDGQGGKKARLVYLQGEEARLRRRLETRLGHFMPSSLLASQLSALEEPTGALIMNIDDAPEVIVAKIQDALWR